MGGVPQAASGAAEDRDRARHKRIVLFHAGWWVAARRVQGGTRLLDGGGRMGDARGGRGQDDSRVDDGRRPEHRPERAGRSPLRRLPEEPLLRADPQLAVLPGSLRHYPPPATYGGAATVADKPLLPTSEGARGVLPGSLWLGAPAVVRGQRIDARRIRRPRDGGVGGAVLVAHRRS